MPNYLKWASKDKEIIGRMKVPNFKSEVGFGLQSCFEVAMASVHEKGSSLIRLCTKMRIISGE